MKAVRCELWGGPGCGGEVVIPAEPDTGEIPAWNPYRLPLVTDHRPVFIDGPQHPGKVIGYAEYERGLPRSGKWLYTFKRCVFSYTK